MAVKDIPSNGDWAEHKKLVMAKLNEHGIEIKALQSDVSEVKMAMAPMPNIAKNVEELVRHQAIADGVAERTLSGIHQLPQEASTLKKVARSNWFQTLLVVLTASAFSIGGFKCMSPGGYTCEAQDIHRDAGKAAAVEASEVPEELPN